MSSYIFTFAVQIFDSIKRRKSKDKCSGFCFGDTLKNHGFYDIIKNNNLYVKIDAENKMFENKFNEVIKVAI